MLSSYACDDYSDVDLEELHKMWSNFDRRAFASTMFRAAGWRLNLGVTQSLVGIEAVADLTSLEMIVLGEADLTPLAECTTLQRVKIISNVEPSIIAVEAFTKLPELAPAHPGLPKVVFVLVRSGVDDIAGRISLTANEDARDRLRSGMRLGTIAP